MTPRALLAAFVVLLAVAAPALASEERPTLRELEGELMCPTCATPLDQSDSPIARRMKDFIAARIEAGATKSEIKDELVAQFGQAVLAAPPKDGFNLLAWVLPLAGLLAAALILGIAAWRWTRRRDALEEPAGLPSSNGRVPLDPELELRLDEALARYDG
jgi:cytochrome c-type biogenesis protein CcmH